MRICVQWVAVLMVAACPSVAFAQGATRPAKPSTPAQDEAIRKGAALHDQGKFADAIAVYEGVLKENADNMLALYELAYSQLELKEYASALASATRGLGYQSEQLPMFYDLIGSAHDLMGEPQKAIDAYNRGIAAVPTASMLYYNKGVTELESLNNRVAARASFERAITVEPMQAPAHLMLGQIFQQDGYPVPGFFAFSMSLILEPGGPQALRSYGFLRTVLRGGLSNDPNAPQNQAVARGMRPVAPAAPRKTDEGDFSAPESQLAGSHQRLLQQLDSGTLEASALVQQVDGLLTQLAARDLSKDRATFSGRHYLPFFVELKKRGYVEAFVNWAIQRSPVEGPRLWLQANQPKAKEFLDWVNHYEWPER